MTRTTRLMAAAVLGGAVMFPAGIRAQAAPTVMLRQATELADIKGDLKGAIELYKKVADGPDRAAAAQALLRMAECYQKLGDKDARRAYERLVRDFADQKEAAVARTRLGARAAATASRGDRAVWTGQHVDLFGTVSPDGRYLTYIDWDKTGNLMVRDLVANTDRSLTNNVKHSEFGGADWSTISRDGTQVAYDWWVAGGPLQFELKVAPLSGSGVPVARVIWRGTGGESIRPFDWSPDGRTLAVLVEREDRTSQLGTLAVADGTLRVLKSVNWRGVSKAVFSADGRYIAYDLDAGDGSRHSSVYVIAVDASREAAVVADASRNTVMGWSSDGRHVLFASDRTGTLGLWALPVDAGKPAGAPLMLRSDFPSAWSLGTSSSGTLYVWKHASAGVVKTMPVNLESGEVGASQPAFQRFVESRGRPQFSDDGKELLFVSCGPTGGGPCTLTIHGAETGSVRNVTHTLAYVQVPRLSPDRRLIATNGSDLKGRRGLYLIDLQTHETSLMLAADDANRAAFLDWTADGTSIIYASGRQGQRRLIKRDVRSGTETNLALTEGCVFPVRIAPDRMRYGCPLADASGKVTGLQVAPLDGGRPQVVFKAAAGEDFSGQWVWMPGGRGAILKKQLADTKEELWMVPFSGKPTRLPIDTGNWMDPIFDIHPSGRQIAFTASAGAPGAEVWAFENLLPVATAKR